jgi:hypothetical protein
LEATRQRKLLALGQLAAPQGTVEEAGTFIKDLVSEGAKHRKSTKKTMGLEQMGVKFDKYGRMESPEQMIESVMRGTKGDITKIEDIFGKRGTPLFRALQNPYIQAGGGEAGIAAVRKTMAGVTGATMDAAGLESQHEQIMSTPAAKFALAVNRIEETLKDKLEPRLAHFADKTLPALIPKFEAIIDAASGFADWFADNPIKGVGAIILAAVTKDIAGAAIGEAVKAAILRMMAGGAAGGGVPGAAGAAGAAGGIIPKAIAVAGAGLAGWEVGKALIDRSVAEQNASQTASVLGSAQASADAGAWSRAARAGKVTPAQLAALQRRATALAAETEEKRQAIGSNPMGVAQTAMMGLFGGKEGQQFAQDTRADQTAQFKASKAALDDLRKAISAASASLNAMAAAGTGAARNGPMPSRADPRHP